MVSRLRFQPFVKKLFSQLNSLYFKTSKFTFAEGY